MVRIGITCIVVLLGFSLILHAAPNEEVDTKHALDEITVKGTTVQEPVASPYAIPASSRLQTEVFTREDIEAIHPETFYDVLQFTPGVELTYQGRQQFNFTKVRGQGNFGLIIDGVYIPYSTFTRRILATFPIDDIESVTIVRDATALTLGPLTNFGSDNGSSNQGFIVIRTRRAARLESGVVASYGSFHAQKEHVYFGDKIKNFDYRIAFTHQETLGKTDWYMGNRSDTAYFRGGYTGRMVDFDMFYYNSNGMREMQRAIGDDGTLNSAKWKWDPMLSSLIGMNLSKPWDARQTTTFTYSYNRTDFDLMQSTFPRQAPQTSTHSNEWFQNLNLKHVVAFDNNTLRLGGQLLSQMTVQDMYSTFVHDEHRLFNNRLAVDGGIRVDRKYYRESPTTTDRDMHEWSKETYTYAVGVAYKINPIFTATGRYAYSENSMASYQVDPATKAALPPERRSRYEGGFLANVHPAFNPALTVFYYDTKNQVVSTTGKDPNTGKTVTNYIDPKTGQEVDYVTTADRVLTTGAEIVVNGIFLKSFSYMLNCSYLTTNDTATNLGQPHVTATGRLGYRYKNLEANVNVVYYGPWYTSRGDGGMVSYYTNGDFYNWGANVNYRTSIFHRPARITVYGQNLADTSIVTTYRSGMGTWPDPGRRFGIELAYSFF